MDASVNRIPLSSDERTIVIGIRLPGEDNSFHSLEELERLVVTAGAKVVLTRMLKRERLDPASILGKGHLEELDRLIRELNARLVVFDLNAIRPAQVRNLEERLKCRVVGRTEIIMEIFARRARSSEAKIQVELAQLKYILPRLKGLGGVLSRLGGGIGTRGPGEKMLETDRRHIARRIAGLNRRLAKIQRHRALTRKARRREFVGAVVGYTNAGKSTLINTLAHDDLFVEDRLFATLDSYTRSVYLGDNARCLLVDTVGFIRNLPAHLVESFKSTLEEIQYADFLVHVVDLSSLDMERCMETVTTQLAALNCADRETILFFNKVDRCADETRIARLHNRYPRAIVGSAVNGTGCDELKMRIREIMPRAFLAGS